MHVRIWVAMMPLKKPFQLQQITRDCTVMQGYVYSDYKVSTIAAQIHHSISSSHIPILCVVYAVVSEII